MNVRVALLGLFMVLAIVFASTAAYESGIRTTTTSTSTSASTATSVSTIATTSFVDPALADAYRSHIGAIESRNATALAAQYETNAKLLYTVPHGIPPNGSFDGSANVIGFYLDHSCNDCIQFNTYAAANDTRSIAMSNGGNTGNVTSNLILYGNANHSCCWPDFSATTAYYVVRFDISYILQGDLWLISTESLTVINFTFCSHATLSSDGSVYTCLDYAS